MEVEDGLRVGGGRSSRLVAAAILWPDLLGWICGAPSEAHTRSGGVAVRGEAVAWAAVVQMRLGTTLGTDMASAAQSQDNYSAHTIE